MNQEQKWLSRRFLIYKFFSNIWFISAIWLYFYRIFITDAQVGILDGLAFAIGLLAEIPSGALADKFGRKRLVVFGQTLAGTGIIIQALGSHFSQFFIGQAILMIGLSFVSGADEALFFERLHFDRTSKQWRKLMTRVSQITVVATLIATIIGGWLHSINPRMPWVLTGISFLLSALLMLNVKDTHTRTKQRFAEEIQDYVNNISVGFKQFWAPQLRLYIPIIVVVQGLFYTAGYGLLRIQLLDRFHFTPFAGSIVIALSGILTVSLLSFMHKKADNLHEKRVISWITINAACALFSAIYALGNWGFFVILVLYAGEHLLQPFMSETINYHASEKQRATVLSVASFLRAIPYVFLGPLLGWLNVHGKLHYFLGAYSALLVAVILIYLTKKRRDDVIHIET